MAGATSQYVFSTTEGRALVRKTLRNAIPYDPHDYQLEGVCEVLDGRDLLAALATGSGKTGFYYMYMLMLIELSENPSLCDPPYPAVPKDPAMVAVYPTIGLEEQLATDFSRFGLRSLVINANTLDAARTSGESLWAQARAGVTVIILSPEQLTSRGFEGLLQNHAFRDRVCTLGIDEVHALDMWGSSFRKSYRQIGFVRARMPSRVRIIATSATIRTGNPKATICRSLGFRLGEFYELRRSNVRRNVRPIFRFLNSGLGGWTFPDLDWLVDDGRKTVVFCRTIALGFRLLTYLWHKLPHNVKRGTYIRLYNALNWPSYNTHSRHLMQYDPDCKILVATTTFMMGVDIPNIFRVIILGEPESTEEWLQWLGRALHDVRSFEDGECVTYVTKKAVENARGIIDGDRPRGTAKKGGPSDKGAVQSRQMDIAMAKILLASCKVAEQNAVYDNPLSNPQCLCETCTETLAMRRLLSDCITPRPCNCSGPGDLGCQPEALPDTVARTKAKDNNAIPKSKRLTRAMRAVGTQQLLQFRDIIYSSASTPSTRLFPPIAFLPDPTIKTLLDEFALITSLDQLRLRVSEETFLLPHLDELWTVLLGLQTTFTTMRKEARSRKKTKDGDENNDEVEDDEDEPAIDESDMGPNQSEAARQLEGDDCTPAWSTVMEWDLHGSQYVAKHWLITFSHSA
ncbi:P-loop containing nucleoside triphosphate hydrolase protein [Fomitopsis betulina]|nr:P-loop containing nucleoside triphosphate hydrolase protein [Fomitopsis betulina]